MNSKGTLEESNEKIPNENNSLINNNQMKESDDVTRYIQNPDIQKKIINQLIDDTITSSNNYDDFTRNIKSLRSLREVSKMLMEMVDTELSNSEKYNSYVK